jgi:hypothetical protein
MIGPLAVSAMLCIDDLVSNDGTQVIPFTHKVERMPSRELIERHALTIEVTVTRA